MFARFDENPAMALQDIKETKRYGRTHGLTDGRENSIPTTKFAGGIKKSDYIAVQSSLLYIKGQACTWNISIKKTHSKNTYMQVLIQYRPPD